MIGINVCFYLALLHIAVKLPLQYIPRFLQTNSTTPLCSGGGGWWQARASRAGTSSNITSACGLSESWDDRDIGDEALGVLGAELLGSLKTTWDGGGAHGTETVVGRAGLGVGGADLSNLDLREDEAGVWLDDTDV